MTTKKKMLMSSAGTAAAAGGGGLDIDDVFSTYLYEGTGSAQTITNGIDLDGEGGLVWIKSRTGVVDHNLMDTARGLVSEGGGTLTTTSTSGQGNNAQTITSFNSNGFTVGTEGSVSTNAMDFASWTFRKAPKFFDVVTYTGTGVAGRTLSHNLGSVPGMVIVKPLTTGEWSVYHRGVDSSSPEDYYLQLDRTAARIDDATRWNDTAPTSTVITLGNNIRLNENGEPFVAYLFAHNDSGDGEFGPDGDQDIIKCGSFSGFGTTVNLGFEPQWLLVKRTDGTGDWLIADTMRGIRTGGADSFLSANNSNAETSANNWIDLTATGFTNLIGSGTYIYMAIRRGPLAVPEDATEVFTVDAEDSASFNNPPLYVSGFPVDFALRKQTNNAASWIAASRLTGNKTLSTASTAAEVTTAPSQFDYNNGWYDDPGWNAATYSWMWKRAPGHFDAVAFTGDGVAGRTVSHNLGVAPEMMWVKKRNQNSNWEVYLHSQGGTKRIYLDYPNAIETTSGAWNNTDATDTVFSLGTSSQTNQSGGTFIAYLFASVDNVSKVGSYTGNGSSQTINCGFTSGARFILIKRTDSTGDWYVWDSVRGIVSANSPHLSLNTTAAEVTSDDSIDPASSGFIVNQVGATNINVSSANYIFYAIA